MRTPWSIRVFVLLVVISAVTAVFLGCGPAGESFVSAVYVNDKLFLNDLKVYIEKDNSLSKESRKLRIDSIDMHLKMIDAEYKRVNGEEAKE